MIPNLVINNIVPVFPGFRRKALTLSYDDAIASDRRLIEIMEAHGLRGTFNINSGLYQADDFVPRATDQMSRQAVTDLYKNRDGIEVALHGFSHATLDKIPPAQALMEIVRDRQNLEAQFGCIVRGFAYPNGSFNDTVVEILRACGIVYGRTVRSSHNFELPADWLRLSPTCHHSEPDFPKLTDDFLAITEKVSGKSPKLFYVWGHSYEFENSKNWDLIEEFAEKVGGRDDIWYATNGEIYDYLDAYRRLVFGIDCTTVWNPSAIPVMFRYHSADYLVNPGETLEID